MLKYLLLLSSVLLLGASKCGDKKGQSACTELGTIKDFTGLDGCKMMIVLDNGEKLQPVNYDKSKLDQELKDGQRIKFAYKEVDDMVSNCMAGKMVEVTCIEFLEMAKPSRPAGTGGIKPIKIPCVETLDPYYKEWMVMAMETTRAYQVIRYRYRTDGWAYYFIGPTENRMFDCQGTLICECSAKDSKCDNQAKNYSKELVIWEKD